MKILIISQYFPPEIGAAATRWSEYAHILTSEGHQVMVISELPNYPSGTITQGYPKWTFHEEETQNKNLRVVRVPVWANKRKTTIQRLGFYTSFMLSATLRALLSPKFDMIIVSSPPLFVGLIATFIRPFKRAKYVLDLRDIWPESAQVLGEIKSRQMLGFGKMLERWVYRSVDAFLLAVPGFKNYLEKNFPNYSSKPKLDLMNGVSQSFMKKIGDTANNKTPSKFTVLFSGNIGLAQGLETVLDAADRLRSEEIEFKLIGDGAKLDELVAYADSLNLENVTFLNSIPRDQLISEICSAQVCLVPLIKSPLFLNAIPSKMLEYMAAGKPVIVGIKGEVEAILASSQGGVSIEPEEPEALAAAVLLYKNSEERRVQDGDSGRAFVLEGMTKEAIMRVALRDLGKYFS